MPVKYNVYITNFNESKFNLVKDYLIDNNLAIKEEFNFKKLSREIYCIFLLKTYVKNVPKVTYTLDMCNFLDKNMYNIVNMNILYREKKLNRICQ